jgi:glycosyltransferase involved in cell wall biosynthesis
MKINNKRPLVSIVIPSYNHALELKKALRTVVAQTVTDWEAWVINNYSQDNTIEIIEQFNDARIQRVDFHNNGVIARSRNEGIRRARSKLIAFLDSDDLWQPNKLERVLNIFNNNPKVDLVCHWENISWNNNLKRICRYGERFNISYRHLLFKRNQVSTSTVTVKREFLERVAGFDEDPSLITAEDYDLWLKLTSAGCHIYCLPEVLGEYRITGKNMSARIDTHFTAVTKVIMKHYVQRQHKSIIDPLLLHRRLAKVDYGKAWAYFRAGAQKKAFQNILVALAKWPFSLKIWFALFRFSKKID